MYFTMDVILKFQVLDPIDVLIRVEIRFEVINKC